MMNIRTRGVPFGRAKYWTCTYRGQALLCRIDLLLDWKKKQQHQEANNLPKATSPA